MPDLPDRICYECVFLEYNEAMPRYSELTPGDSAELRCQKGHWYIITEYAPDMSELAKNIRLADTCADFKPARWARELKK